MRIVIILGLGWLTLTATVLAKSVLRDGISSYFTSDTDNTIESGDPANSMESASIDTPAQPERRAIDRELDGVSPAQRVDLVEHVLLNGAVAQRPRSDSDPDADDVVTLWAGAKPFNVMVRFRRSAFRAGAPGVLGPFCGQRVNYEFALFDGSATSDYNMSEVQPVSFLLPCERGSRSRNARSYEEFPATTFLVGGWGFKAQCGNEAYALGVNFRKGYPIAPSQGEVFGLSIDRIEEPQWKGQMQVKRDRETGTLTFSWYEDSRALHGIDRRFEFRSTSVGESLMRGDIKVSDEEGERMCGTWVADRVPPAVK